jgi:hypothetical protein
MFPAPSGPSRFQEAEAEVGLGIDSAAEKRRKVKSELFPHKDRVKKARLFGFNKIAVTLSSRCLQHYAVLCCAVLCYAALCYAISLSHVMSASLDLARFGRFHAVVPVI